MDLERLPSFSALLVKTVVIVTIFWRDVIYASFMAFFWCHVIYWHAIACTTPASEPKWSGGDPFSFKIKLSRSAARRSHYKEIMNHWEILSSRAHFSRLRGLSYRCETSKYLQESQTKRETWTVWNMLCNLTSVIFNDSLVNLFKKKNDSYLVLALMIHGPDCLCMFSLFV